MITPMSNPEYVYKIVDQATWLTETVDGRFRGMPIDLTDGYCHLSTAAQLGETLSLHFRGRHDLLVLAVRSFDLGGGLRWEASRGGQLFPHYYGALPLSAVAWTAPVSVAADGGVELPDAVV